jgi:uncharacterized protein (DUF302 family)
MVYEESVVLDIPFADAVAAVKVAFAESGFGTLTEIDLQQTLHAKVGKEMERYVIIGACNPKLASAALDAEPLIGVLLPCNVVVREVGGRVFVDAMDPGLMATMTGSEELEPIATEARQLVNEALRKVADAS